MWFTFGDPARLNDLPPDLAALIRSGEADSFNDIQQSKSWPSYNAQRVDLSDGEYREFRFGHWDFRGANFSNAHFVMCDFWGADLRGLQAKGDVVFDRCVFDVARITDTIMGPTTRFIDCRFLDTRVDSYVYAILRDNGLKEAQIMHVQIDDEYVRLRLAFGGFNTVIHALALIAFAAPYVLFTLFAFLKSQEGLQDGPSISIANALARYIASGGETYLDWTPSPYALTIFSAVCVYNIIRVFLVWGTRKLEHQAVVTQRAPVHVPSSLSRLRKASILLFRLYIPIIALHILQFLSRRIPLE